MSEIRVSVKVSGWRSQIHTVAQRTVRMQQNTKMRVSSDTVLWQQTVHLMCCNSSVTCVFSNAEVFSPSSCWHTCLLFIFYTQCWLQLEWETRSIRAGSYGCIMQRLNKTTFSNISEYRCFVWTDFAENNWETLLFLWGTLIARLYACKCQSAGRSVHHFYWMYCHAVLYRHLRSPEDESYYFGVTLAVPLHVNMHPFSHPPLDQIQNAKSSSFHMTGMTIMS